MFDSSSYLDLRNRLQLKKAAIKAIEKYDTGSVGLRFLYNTLNIHIKQQTAEQIDKQDKKISKNARILGVID